MTERQPPFKNHSCGLGTFLDIANRAISEKCRNGEYTAADIDVLQTNVFISLYHLGSIAETLGMERIDYMDDPYNTSHTALMVFGRAVQEMAYTLDTITPYIRKHQTAAAPMVADDTFPPPNGC